VFAELQVDDVAFFEVDDLVGHAGEPPSRRRRESSRRRVRRCQCRDQRRAFARADHAVRLVAAEHRDRVGPAQARKRALDRIEQIAVVQVVDQVAMTRCRSGLRTVAAALQLGAQLVVVLDDAVVHQRDPARAHAAADRYFGSETPGRG